MTEPTASRTELEVKFSEGMSSRPWGGQRTRWQGRIVEQQDASATVGSGLAAGCPSGGRLTGQRPMPTGGGRTCLLPAGGHGDPFIPFTRWVVLKQGAPHPEVSRSRISPPAWQWEHITTPTTAATASRTSSDHRQRPKHGTAWYHACLAQTRVTKPGVSLMS